MINNIIKLENVKQKHCQKRIEQHSKFLSHLAIIWLGIVGTVVI